MLYIITYFDQPIMKKPIAIAERASHIAVFQESAIRRVWHNEEWWFAVVDVVGVLTDSVQPEGYVKDLRRLQERALFGDGDERLELLEVHTGCLWTLAIRSSIRLPAFRPARQGLLRPACRVRRGSPACVRPGVAPAG